MFRRGGGFHGLVTCILVGLKPGFRFLDFASFGVLSLTTGILICLAPRFFGSRQDGDLFLLAAFRIAAGGIALLFDQRPLPRGLLGCRQRTPGAGRGAGSGGAASRGNRDIARGGGRRACR
jgi:hypothetical protein